MKPLFTKPARIYLALPNYSGKFDARAFSAVMLALRQNVLQMRQRGHSLLAHNFNQLWCEALNMRKTHGMTHFVMLHNDIVPQHNNWITILQEEQKKVKADILSVVVPIKGPEGITSTAIPMENTIEDLKGIITPYGFSEINKFKDTWPARRITMKEVFKLPPTFTLNNLLVNTGCFIADIRKPWAENVLFTIQDTIVCHKNGTFTPIVYPEDWHFSRMAQKAGASVWATRAVEVSHVGENHFVNNDAWGTEKHDPLFEVDESQEDPAVPATESTQ